MKRKILIFLSYVLVSALTAALTLALVFRQAGEYSKLAEMSDIIQTYFVDGVDKTALEDAAAEAMVASIGDRWSYYIPASEYESHRESAENAYVGIGITITETEEGLRILEVNPGSSAQEAGLLPEDVIIAIDGQDAVGMAAAEARNLVRGKEGTAVTLTIRRGEETLTLSPLRRLVQVEVASGELLEGSVGLVTIANFDERCAQETLAAIQSLRDQGAEMLIFDVRNNSGGYAQEMVEVLDHLLPEGDLFRTVDFAGREEVETSDKKYLDLPMAVLVNSRSYSAAEFFAAALQEYQAALVVGEKTTGKGHFQVTFPLSDGSALNLSIGTYYTPGGISLEGQGITPDVPVLLDEDVEMDILYNRLPSREDPQIQAALAALRQAE